MSFPARGSRLTITAAHWQPAHVLSLISTMKHVYFSSLGNCDITRQIKIVVQEGFGVLEKVHNEMYEMSESGHL